MAAARGATFDIEIAHPESAWVGAGEPILYVTGPLYHLVDLETVLLQKLGPACVAAYNASAMCADLPRVAFLAMDARHCAGAEMAELMAYAASVGSAHARRVAGAVGFVGCATDATAHFFGGDKGLGTMPHALIGYAGSTVRAAEMFRETFPDEPLTVLVDYFGREISDAVEVCRRFPDLATGGRLAFRMDTPGGRYCEGLDVARSYEVLERNAPGAIRGYRTEARAAPSDRHRRHGGGAMAYARGAERGRVSERPDRREFRVRSREVPHDGGGQRADRRDRHRLLPPRAMERDLRDGRHHRL